MPTDPTRSPIPGWSRRRATTRRCGIGSEARGSVRTHRFRALGGPCCLQFAAPGPAAWERAAQAAQAEVLRIEAKYSRYRDDSVLSRINAAAGRAEGIEVDDETARLLDYAAQAYAQSDGLFDITSGVLRRAWDFRQARLPAPGTVESLLPLVGWTRVRWTRPRLVLPIPGQELDFGGFGKEYAVDCVVAVLRGHGVRHGLVELGGDLRALGPQPDGSPWSIGIRDPRGAADSALARVDLAGGALATSGDYERFFEHEGRRYCHILDPRTGWPVEGPASVSVLADQCLVAGTVTTIALLQGGDAADWLQQAGLPWLCVSRAGDIAGSLSGQLK